MRNLNSSLAKAEALVKSPFFLKRVFCRSRHCDDGNALVEMALCLPILLAVVSAITSFGWYFNNYISLTEAVSIGARQLSLDAGNTASNDPCATTVSAIEAATPGLAASRLTFSFTLNGTSYPSTTSCPGAISNVVSGSTATVTATYSCTALVIYGSDTYGTNLFPGCSMTSTISELVQ